MGPRLRILSLTAFVAACIVVLALSGAISVHRVRDAAEGHGVLGPLLFIAASSLLTVAFFPGPILSGAAGLVFGTALGFPVSLVSAVLGASLAFALARWWAHDAVVEVAGPRVSAFREFVGRKGFLAIFTARLAPGLPYNAVNYGAGLTPIRLPVFAAATAIGAAPRAFAYTALGGNLGNLGSWQAIVALAVLVVMALAGLAVAARDPEITAAVRSLGGRPSRR
ncbi:TVP38/TMEM64 family protein [Paraconexibacter antarcticus]|uniref:TVP38/TMEM64 family membrane protein n=1 Tax=Paraconexibacter antarcticus TaxID=2949664 RepID=A0ABY5DQA5_9ACTN|nr:TVP38/TMEM64 family protein [Paraconexibacter antarcticus]UTI64208.1 TVP38/TMEM64 family protein [Paraconexibacter antarcticus]